MPQNSTPEVLTSTGKSPAFQGLVIARCPPGIPFRCFPEPSPIDRTNLPLRRRSSRQRWVYRFISFLSRRMIFVRGGRPDEGFLALHQLPKLTRQGETRNLWIKTRRRDREREIEIGRGRGRIRKAPTRTTFRHLEGNIGPG
jgi:hypothetical protein